MRRILTVFMVVVLIGCAHGELAVDPPSTAETCVTDSDCTFGNTCAQGRCEEGCLSDSDCGQGRCVPHEVGPGGWCDVSATDPGDETVMSPGGTSVSPAPEPPPPGEPVTPGMEPEDETSPEDAPPASPPPPVERPSPPPVEPPSQPDPEPEPEPAPEPEPNPEADPPCAYPRAGGAIRLGSVLPRLSWPTAYTADGGVFGFDLEDFHCDPAYARYTILVVVVGAEWCNACGQYLRQLAPQAAAIEAAGGLLLYVETQDNQQNWISSRRANQVINGYVGGAPGIRVGDGETAQEPGAVYNAPIVSVLPTIFAVRRSDMQVIEEGARDWAAVAGREGGGGGAPPAAPPNAPPGD